MLRYTRWLIPAVVLVAITTISACAHRPRPSDGWIHFHPDTQRYSIDASAVPRGALLDELAVVAKADVRPQPDRAALVTAHARGLDLEALVTLLLPPGVRPTIRAGDREIAGTSQSAAFHKQGLSAWPDPAAPAKPDPALDGRPALQRDGAYKADAELPLTARPISGVAKAPAAMLVGAVQDQRTKQPRAARAERATVRLTLQFDQGSAPRLIAASTIEGRAPVQRFVVGQFLFAVVGADGRVLQAGSFDDPLIEHSYQPNGPHEELRARTGVVGISVLRENLAGTRVQIVDMTGVPLPRELTEEVTRRALATGRTVLQLDSKIILRSVEQEAKK